MAFVSDEEAKWLWAFYYKSFQPSVIIGNKAGAYLIIASFNTSHIGQAPSLAHKYFNRQTCKVQMLERIVASSSLMKNKDL